MLLPWVSREMYERVISDYNRLATEYNALEEARASQVTQWGERYDRLLAMYHELKLQGAGPSSSITATPPLPLPKRERDDVYDAIELQAGNDSQLKRHLTRWAKTQQLEGMDSTAIINGILHWQSDDDADHTGSVNVR